MTARQIFKTALDLLGFTEAPNFQLRAVAVINAVYSDLYPIAGAGREFNLITSLSDKIDLPPRVLKTVMPLGVAEKIALSEGDGELQQYFAVSYDKARQRINRLDKVYDELP